MLKMSNTKLLVLLVVLIAIVGAVFFIDSRRGEGNFKQDIILVDTAQISKITMFPKSKKGEQVRLVKEGGVWVVQLRDNRKAKVDNTQVSQIFDALTDMKATMLASRTPDKWAEYEVDTTGTRVVITEGNEDKEIIIGKMNFKQGTRSMETYVRVKGEDDVYLVPGFLDPMFNKGTEDWRNKKIVSGNKDEWTQLSFSLPESNYELVQQDSVWMIDGQQVDLASVDSYLSELSRTTGTAFADDVDAATLGTPQYNLVITDKAGDKITVKGYLISDRKILHSSLNPDNLFAGEGLFDKIFAGKEKFTVVAAEEVI